MTSTGSNLGDPPGAEVAIQAGQSSSPCKIDCAGQLQARLGQNHVLSLLLADHLDCCPDIHQIWWILDSASKSIEGPLTQSRREEGAVKRLRGRGCFTVAAATAPELLGQV